MYLMIVARAQTKQRLRDKGVCMLLLCPIHKRRDWWEAGGLQRSSKKLQKSAIFHQNQPQVGQNCSGRSFLLDHIGSKFRAAIIDKAMK